ncbi:hypothetical protein Tco_0178077 [Tanacetum coccineum]
MKYFKVHISQLIPLGLNKVVSFEIVCRDLGIIPTVMLFRVFQILCRQGDCFSFAKRRNTEDVCTDEGLSSMKKWKNKFFLIDRRAILDYLTLRHSHSCVSDDLPTDGYDRDDVARLCARLIRLHEINEAVLENAKVVEEPHEFASSILQRVQSNTIALAIEGTHIPLPTLDEVFSEPDQPRRKRRLRRKASEAGSSTSAIEQAQDAKGADFSNYCLVRPPPYVPRVAFSDPSHVGTSDAARASFFGHTNVRKGVATVGSSGKARAEVPEDDFATASLGEVINLC